MFNTHDNRSALKNRLTLSANYDNNCSRMYQFKKNYKLALRLLKTSYIFYVQGHSRVDACDRSQSSNRFKVSQKMNYEIIT